MSKSEMENVLDEKGDFIQIDIVSKFLDRSIGLKRDTKKFLFLRLAEIYERRLMVNEAAKMYDNLGILVISYSEKIKYFLIEAKLFISKGEFQRADEAVKKAMSQANSTERENIYFEIKNLYKEQARKYDENMMLGRAMKVYEKLLEMRLDSSEREEVKGKLLVFYDKLGERQKYNILKGLGD
jgi:tetratricopeptide (TPR) repeat protein